MSARASVPFSFQVSEAFPVLVEVDKVIPHPGWVAAFKAVRAGLASGTPVVLAGEPGLGKSLLLKTLKRELELEGRAVVLLPSSGSDRTVRSSRVVLVDEADRVPAPLLCQLVNCTAACVLAGSRRLIDAVGASGVSPMLVEMRPLSLDEVGPNMLGQLERAGLWDNLLSADALAALARSSGGIPRRSQKLANQASSDASMGEAELVSATHVTITAARMVAGTDDAAGEHPPRRDVVATTPALPPRIAAGRIPSGLGRAMDALSRPVVLLPGVACCLALLALLALHDARPTKGRTALPLPPDAVPAEPQPDLQSKLSEPVPVRDFAAREPAEDAPALPPEPGLPPQGAIANLGRHPQQELTTAPTPVSPGPPPVTPFAAAVSVPVRPATTPVHVSVSFTGSDAAAMSRAVSTVGTLQEAGMNTTLAVELRSTKGGPVTYFYANDQPAAAAVARRIGATGREQLVAATGLLPRPGTIRVLISSEMTSGSRTP